MCYSLWYNAPTMLSAGSGNIVGALSTRCNTQSSAPEDGQNNFPKHVELTGIINKPLLLHLVGVHVIEMILFLQLTSSSMTLLNSAKKMEMSIS